MDETDDKKTVTTPDEIGAPTLDDQTASTTSDNHDHKPHFKQRLKAGIARWWKNPKSRYGTLLGLLAVIVILLAVPFTRYAILGTVLKSDVFITVTDKTGKPVSGANVTLSGQQKLTNASGKATIHAKLGKSEVTTAKKYYRSSIASTTVTLSKKSNTLKLSITSLGREVPVKVINKITGKPLTNATIAIDGSQTKTDKAGLANVILSPDETSQKAKLSLAGFNNSNITIAVKDTLTSSNTFGLTPSGKIYFLSNESGHIDVVKSNLDGTDRQTVLAGTGNEESSNTSLLASRDWKYLALLAKRTKANSATASVYLIDTTKNDKFSTIDEGNANFTLSGWSGHQFLYTVNRNEVKQWQPNAQALKSYNAESGKLATLDQTSGEGSSDRDFTRTTFSNIYLLDNEVVYGINYSSSYYRSSTGGRNVSLVSVKPDGSKRKVVRDFAVPSNVSYYEVNLRPYEPNSLYIQTPDYDGGAPAFYEYEAGKLSEKTDLTQNAYYKSYPTYLQSPDNNATFWTELRDGKNTLFVGDAQAKNASQIASLSKYTPYGWYSSDYLLVSLDGSELYIMPRTGGSALKVTDYYRPDIDYRGYGGGYGGL